MRNGLRLCPSRMFPCQFKNNTFSPAVTHFTACNHRGILWGSDGWGSSRWADCPFEDDEGGKKTAKPKRKEGKP